MGYLLRIHFWVSQAEGRSCSVVGWYDTEKKSLLVTYKTANWSINSSLRILKSAVFQKEKYCSVTFFVSVCLCLSLTYKKTNSPASQIKFFIRGGGDAHSVFVGINKKKSLEAALKGNFIIAIQATGCATAWKHLLVWKWCGKSDKYTQVMSLCQSESALIGA